VDGRRAIAFPKKERSPFTKEKRSPYFRGQSDRPYIDIDIKAIALFLPQINMDGKMAIACFLGKGDRSFLPIQTML
jgi:hypothetical protein